jgi:hypothetical protein
LTSFTATFTAISDNAVTGVAMVISTH